jgi:DNA-binding CsgD family transcriptional regulator
MISKRLRRSKAKPAKKKGTGRPTGRPPIDLEPKLRQIEALAAYGLSDVQIGSIVGVSPATLTARCKDIMDRGRARSLGRVAEGVFRRAYGGDNACAFFVLRAYGGVRDTDKGVAPPAEPPTPTIVNIQALPDDRLIAILARLHAQDADQGDRGGTGPQTIEHEPAIVVPPRSRAH